VRVAEERFDVRADRCGVSDGHLANVGQNGRAANPLPGGVLVSQRLEEPTDAERVEDVPQEVFDATISTNVIGTGNVARAALRVFEKQEGGSLVALGWCSARSPHPS